jgi:hypothetical protein
LSCQVDHKVSAGDTRHILSQQPCGGPVAGIHTQPRDGSLPRRRHTQPIRLDRSVSDADSEPVSLHVVIANLHAA